MSIGSPPCSLSPPDCLQDFGAYAQRLKLAALPDELLYMVLDMALQSPDPARLEQCLLAWVCMGQIPLLNVTSAHYLPPCSLCQSLLAHTSPHVHAHDPHTHHTQIEKEA